MSLLASAERRARLLYPRSRPFQRTYIRGARAALQGAPASECPYPRDPRKTWRQAFRIAWMRGHASVTREDFDP